MSPAFTKRSSGVYLVACDDGTRCVVYNASRIGNPLDHMPDRWYSPHPQRRWGWSPASPSPRPTRRSGRRGPGTPGPKAPRSRPRTGRPPRPEAAHDGESHHPELERGRDGHVHGA